MIDLKNLNIILTGATGVIGNSILDKLVLAGSNVLGGNLKEIIHNPEVGDIVLFPSSLYHGTLPFATDRDRIVVSFDLKPGPTL